MVTTTLMELSVEEALVTVGEGAAFIDLRDVDSYLDVHIPGSIALLYESGPGFNSRARDCVPLDVPLVLLDLGAGDPAVAAAALRGKGFDVVGKVDDGLNAWTRARGAPASTDIVTDRPEGPVILDVSDPGATSAGDGARIPIEELWGRVSEIPDGPVCVVAGYGVRAAIAVGILERAGRDVLFWKTRGERSRR